MCSQHCSQSNAMLLHSIQNCVRYHRINNSCLLCCFIHNLLTQTDELHPDFIKPYFLTGENTVDPKLQWLELQPLTFVRIIILMKTPTVTTKTCIYNQYMQKSPPESSSFKQGVPSINTSSATLVQVPCNLVLHLLL